jgi:hypothetical protein
MSTTDLKKAFLAFRDQCIWLQTCFNTFSALYESDETTNQVLSRSAPLFFYDLNLILIEYCLLQVCKLTDPPRSFGRDNLTVKHINELLKAENKLTPDIAAASDGLAHYRSLIKESRNWLISHADKRAVLAGLPIGAHSKGEVDAFFANLYRYVDAVGHAADVGPLDFRTTAGSGDVVDLLRQLKRV